MNAAKLREYYQQTQLIVSDLQSSARDSHGSELVISKFQQLVKLSIQIRAGVKLFTEKELQAIWIERFRKLHEEIVSISALVLQHDNQSGEQFWNGVVQLLYLGAETVTVKESSISSLSATIDDLKLETSKLSEIIETSRQEKENLAKENLELRTRVLVMQQDIQKKDSDIRSQLQQWQATVKERDALKQENEFLSHECARHMQASDRQTKVIAQLMERSEFSIKERDEAVNTLKQVDEDNHTLRVNLHHHTLVVEKLIGLNAELMESMNLKSQQLEDSKKVVVSLEKQLVSTNSATNVNAEEISGSYISIQLLPEQERQLCVPQANIDERALLASSSETDHSGGDIPVSIIPDKQEEGKDRYPADKKANEIFSNQNLNSNVEESALFQQPSSEASYSKTFQEPGHVLQDATFSQETTYSSLSEGLTSAKGLLKGVGGKAKSFLSYVAGADVAS